MARTNEWETLEMAVGDSKPAWPIPSAKPKFATWSIGGGRPFGCEAGVCKRWHAGIDLTGIAGGAIVVAPEDGVVTAVDRGWSGDAKAVFLRTDSGLFVVLGGFIRGSSKEFGIAGGQRVRKGDRLGRVLGSYAMIHLETYVADGRSANSAWWKGQPPPKGLLNPTNYVERMVGDRISLVRSVQRHDALKALGYYSGSSSDPWSEASTAALKAAQKALGVESDGKWGPATEAAIIGALSELDGGCTDDLCGPVATAQAPETNTGRSPRFWLTVAGVAALGLGFGVGLLMTSRSEAASELDKGAS